MLAMHDEIVPELAWQMGRPVRYGAGELRGFEERARHMIAIAAEALAPLEPAPKRRLPPLHPPRAAGHRVRHRAVELSLSDRGQLDHAGADGRQCRDPQARHADAAGRRALRRGVRAAPACPTGLFQHLRARPRADRGAHRLGPRSTTSTSPARWRRRARSSAPPPARFLGVGLELGGKDPAYVRADANLEHAVENLVDGSFFNSGQSCCGIERIYVDRARLRGLRRALRRR